MSIRPHGAGGRSRVGSLRPRVRHDALTHRHRRRRRLRRVDQPDAPQFRTGHTVSCQMTNREAAARSPPLPSRQTTVPGGDDVWRGIRVLYRPTDPFQVLAGTLPRGRTRQPGRQVQGPQDAASHHIGGQTGRGNGRGLPRAGSRAHRAREAQPMRRPEQRQTARTPYLDTGARVLRSAEKAYEVCLGQRQSGRLKLLDLPLSNCRWDGEDVGFHTENPSAGWQKGLFV